MMSNKEQFYKCHFCGKDKGEVAKLIVGDDSAICNECIDLCVNILDKEKVQSLNDDKTTDAVVRNLEIIGEAAGRLPKEFTDRHSKIEWVKIKGLRNRIVHEYFGVDIQIIWQILEKDLQAFKASLKSIRDRLDS